MLLPLISCVQILRTRFSAVRVALLFENRCWRFARWPLRRVYRAAIQTAHKRRPQLLLLQSQLYLWTFFIIILLVRRRVLLPCERVRHRAALARLCSREVWSG